MSTLFTLITIVLVIGQARVYANCDIKLAGTVRCGQGIDCGHKPYIIYQAYNVKEAGTLPFQSNCVFEKDYMQCSKGEHKLELLGVESYCHIYIARNDQTIDVHFSKTPEKPKE